MKYKTTVKDEPVVFCENVYIIFEILQFKCK